MALNLTQEEIDKLAKEAANDGTVVPPTGVSVQPNLNNIEIEKLAKEADNDGVVVEEKTPILESPIVALEDRPPEEKTQLSQRDIENSEEFVNNIKIYREARYGTKQTAGADLFQGLGGKGVLEATNVNLVDDWLDNYRFTTGNEINALEERDFLQNLAKKQRSIKQKAIQKTLIKLKKH